MKWYQATLEMQSWTASAWQADTIFGHLCWGMRYLHGEGELASFLAAYQDGSPPLLVSNGFPGSLLPKPVLPPTPIDSTMSLKDQREESARHKDSKKVSYLAPEEFARVINGEQFSEVLRGREQHQKEAGKTDEDFETRRVTLKNQISRLTGTTGEEGRLFPFEEFYWKTVSIYLKVQEDFVGKAKDLFDYLAQVGFGKRKSVGYGQVKSLLFKPFDGFPVVSGANGFVSLSNFVPSSGDPAVGNWSLMVKYGKMGDEYSVEEMAFKRPLLMLEAGSTFYDAPCREFYGRLVHGVSPPHPQVVQYAFALPVPMRLP